MRPFLSFVCGLLLAASSSTPAQTSAGPSVQEIVEFTRIVQPRLSDADAMQQQVSPAGSQAFIVTRKADVARDVNRYDIVLLQLNPDLLDSGAPAAPEIVFTYESDQDPYFEDQAVQRVRWWDEKTLIFIGRLRDGVHQVYRLDLLSRTVTQLTHERSPVVSFAASSDLRRLVYALQVPNPPLKDGARSIVIGNQSFWTVKSGQRQLTSQLRKYRFFVADVGSSQPPRPLGEAFFETNHAKPQVSISPDGRWAVLPRYEAARTLDWSRQYPLMKELVAQFGSALQEDPLDYYSNSTKLVARRMVAWRLEDGLEQAILDAPDDSQPASGQMRSDRLWLGDGSSVILAGTHLPLRPDGSTSTASHVIEYWPDSGRWKIIARLAERLANAVASADGFEIVDGAQRRRFQRKHDGVWEETAGTSGHRAVSSAWSVRIREALNQPPDVVAEGPFGQSVRLTTLNPQFDQRAWGRMRPFSWRDASGRPWIGGLLEGAGTEGREKLPLVIQPYSFSPERFYLDGPNRVSGGTSAYPGRAFVREGVLVLAMGFRPVEDSAPFTDDFRKLQLFNEGVGGAVTALVKAGRVDPTRVGIIGWSTTGESVLNLITFSDLPIRAATLADGDANTTYTYSVAYGIGAWRHIEAINQGTPFGPSRSAWISSDPSLNTDCVNAALRIESYAEPAGLNHDIYALLRRQYKPVEMVLIPGGFHSLSTPSERMISLQGNVDWYRFWLKGERRTTPFLAAETPESLQAQYDAWAQMAAMKVVNDAKPRCSRATPLG